MRRSPWFVVVVLALAGCWLTGNSPPPPNPVPHVSSAPDTLPMTTDAKLAVLKDVAATGKVVGTKIEAEGTVPHSPEGKTNLEAWQITQRWAGAGGVPQDVAGLWERATAAEVDAKLEIDAYRQAAANREKEIENIIASAKGYADAAVAAGDAIAAITAERDEAKKKLHLFDIGGLLGFAAVSFALAMWAGSAFPLFKKMIYSAWAVAIAAGTAAVLWRIYAGLIMLTSKIGLVLLGAIVLVGLVHLARQKGLFKWAVKAVDEGLKVIPPKAVKAFKEAANKADVPDKAAKDKLVKELQKES